MAGVGILLLWAGYSIGYYGTNLVRGGNESLMSLVAPGRFQSVVRDGGGGSGGGSGGAASLPGSGTVSPGMHLGSGGVGVGPGAAVPKDKQGKCHLFGLSFMPVIPCPPGS